MFAFYLGLIVPVLGFITVLYQLPKDMQILKKDIEGKNRWERLNKKGKRYVTISFIAAASLEIGLIIKGPETNKTVIIKSPNSNNSVYISKTVKDTKTVKKELFAKNYNNPVMDLLPESKNPQIIGKSLDSLKTQFDIGVINDGIAYNIRDRFIYFFLYKGQLKLINITHRAINESTKDYTESNSRILIPISISPLNNVDTTYFYLKVLYSNNAIDGKDQFPIKKIFYLSLKHPFSSMYDILNFKEVDNQDQYNNIKKKLIKNKYW
jgi:hypothetical protein